jgi:hypothetical protein
LLSSSRSVSSVSRHDFVAETTAFSESAAPPAAVRAPLAAGAAASSTRIASPASSAAAASADPPSPSAPPPSSASPAPVSDSAGARADSSSAAILGAPSREWALWQGRQARVWVQTLCTRDQFSLSPFGFVPSARRVLGPTADSSVRPTGGSSSRQIPPWQRLDRAFDKSTLDNDATHTQS